MKLPVREVDEDQSCAAIFTKKLTPKTHKDSVAVIHDLILPYMYLIKQCIMSEKENKCRQICHKQK